MLTEFCQVDLPNPASSGKRGGFTLVEMMVTSFVALLLILGILNTFTQHRITYSLKGLEQERNQNLRVAMSQIQRDLRMSNSGMVMGMESLSSWFPALSGVTRLPHVEQGLSGRDTLITAGYTGEPIGELALGITAGATSLTLTPDSSLDLPYSPKVGDVLVLRSVEAVKVISVSGNTIRFTTDPAMGTVGTFLSYPAGSELYEVAVATYRIGTYNGVTGLMREDSRFSYTNDGDKLISLHIEEFNLTKTNNELTVELVGRTKAPTIGPLIDNDGYLRESLSINHTLRNSDPKVDAYFWDPDVLLSP
jgi:Tfp pilus assembly protein PilW